MIISLIALALVLKSCPSQALVNGLYFEWGTLWTTQILKSAVLVAVKVD